MFYGSVPGSVWIMHSIFFGQSPWSLTLCLTQAQKPDPGNMQLLIANYDSTGLVRHLVKAHRGLQCFKQISPCMYVLGHLFCEPSPGLDCSSSVWSLYQDLGMLTAIPLLTFAKASSTSLAASAGPDSPKQDKIAED